MAPPRVLFGALVAAAAVGAGIALALAWVAGAFDSPSPVPLRTTASVSATPALAPYWPERLYARNAGGVVTVLGETRSGVSPLGAGFVVDATRGYIVTNSHVVTDSSDAGVTPDTVKPLPAVYVQRADQARVQASIVGFDLLDDVAVLKYDPSSLQMPQETLGNSLDVHVGQPVAAIGAPFGQVESLSVGVVSQIATQIRAPASVCFRTTDAIQTDAAVNPGNSGGPLFDASGRVIGITSQIETVKLADGTELGGSGVAFAVPIEAVRRSVAQLIATGKVVYSWLGVGVVTLTPDIVAQYRLAAHYGAQVTFVEDRTGAAKAGISAGTQQAAVDGRSVHWDGDVITAINGRAIRSLVDLQRVLAPYRPGTKVRVTWYHAGKQKRTATVALSRRSLDDPHVCQATAP